MIGSRPPTESLSEIQAASLLEKIPKSARPRTIVFADGNRAWESHAKSLKIKHAKVSHQNKEWTKQMRRTSCFFLSTVAGTQVADRWWKGLKDYIPKSFPRRLYHGKNTKEHPELEKFVLGYCWRKSLGPLTPHRFLEELCKAVKAMKRCWEEGKKCCIPKKHELMSKNEVVLPVFKTLFFKSTWEKITFRCSENDIFVDEKLLKPYGRLWVGNLVVSSS